MSTHLLDASVWIASMDPADPHSVHAQRLISGVAQGGSLAALELTFYEVANVAVRRWREPRDAQTLVRLVRESCPTRVAFVDEKLADQAIALAEEHQLSVYDASYVAAAKLRGWKLVSTDLRDLVRPGLAITPEAALTN